MTVEQAKQKGFTHRGKLYGFPIYMTDDEAANVEGVNWFYEKCVELFIWIDVTFCIQDCFVLVKGQKL